MAVEGLGRVVNCRFGLRGLGLEGYRLEKSSASGSLS